jgi:hypothetical protein
VADRCRRHGPETHENRNGCRGKAGLPMEEHSPPRVRRSPP